MILFGRQLRFGAMTSALIALAALASPAAAQNPKTTLTLTNATITFLAPTAADYVNGYLYSASGVLFQVDATNGNGSHTTTVKIKATSPDLGNGKVIGDLEWRRSDLAGWTKISAIDAQVEQKAIVKGVLNDPWSNTIFFRLVLNWTTDIPAAYTANYQLTLSQTVP